ncbi:PIN domain-containing protein [Oscillatoria sp. FACHB-1406]|uniref:PIN domain-containing protein n=1 Tax=Oscillatoria sp. FACHB-1406 TaxID=2692846 RepID=UPI0016872909|nr:PIN domain-containing protein [Oscillatoria sp. FACHB-1406]MBD2578118.1 PIN domain-containing protein [Oscillatoria sp. FACHB-1406]
MTRIYLDTSAYNRPFDDQTQPKIFLESQAVTLVLQMIEAKYFELISSSVLEYENSRNPFPIKQEAMNRYLQLSEFKQEINDAIAQRASNLEDNGLKAIDALHIASAEASGSHYFITCDKRLINRCSGLSLRVINPVDFVLESANEYPS